MIRRHRPWSLIALLLIATPLAIYPIFQDATRIASLRDVLLFSLFAVSLDLFWGKTGTLSFGHATFFGAGAYGMAIATIDIFPGTSYGGILGLFLGIALAGSIALVVGYFLIFGGVRGAYFTVVTLALTILAQQIAIGWSDVTGGDAGLIGVPRLVIGITLSGTPFYYAVLALLSLTISSIWWLFRGRRALILKAIEDDEQKAQTLGFNTSVYLLATFVGSGLIAGFAGALYATANGFVAPDMIALVLSTEVIMWVAVGGRGTLVGPVVGTMIVWRLQQDLSSLSASAWPLFIGAFFVLMVFAFPDGIPAALQKLWLRLPSRVVS